MITRTRVLIAAILLGLSVPARAQPAPPAVPVETMYADAVSKEMAVHAAMTDPKAQPTVLKAVRTVVGDYEAIVRAFPSSGYSDDALWRAGLVSIDAFNKFGDAHDKDAALRLLRSLSAQYPTSKLAKNVPAVIAPLAQSSLGSAQTAAPQPAVPQSAINNLQPAISPARSTITSVTRAVLPDAVRVTIAVDGEVPFHDERIDGPDRIFVDFPATKAIATLVDKTLRFDGDTDPVHQVRIGRHTEDSTRVVLDASGVSSYSVYLLYNPYRLVIDCVRVPSAPPVASRPLAKPLAPSLKGRLLLPDLVSGPVGIPPANATSFEHLLDPEPVDGALTASASAAPPPSPLPPASAFTSPDHNLAGGFSFSRQLGLGVSRVVIDPGHGGHDPGAPGKGISEAELVLDVSLRLEKLLQKAGVEVILTRRTDDYVSLQERTLIANRERADLFLSIHANASANELARGIETYYLNFASNMTSAAVAARENAASGQPMGALPDFAKSIALNNKLDESRDFAMDVQRAMIEKLKVANKTVKDLGVKQAPFMVLIGAAMPSVLAEISFVTNEPEAKLLKGSVYRQKIAEALFAAVRKYQTSLKSVATAAREP